MWAQDWLAEHIKVLTISHVHIFQKMLDIVELFVQKPGIFHVRFIQFCGTTWVEDLAVVQETIVIKNNFCRIYQV